MQVGFHPNCSDPSVQSFLGPGTCDISCGRCQKCPNFNYCADCHRCAAVGQYIHLPAAGARALANLNSLHVNLPQVFLVVCTAAKLTAYLLCRSGSTPTAPIHQCPASWDPAHAMPRAAAARHAPWKWCRPARQTLRYARAAVDTMSAPKLMHAPQTQLCCRRWARPGLSATHSSLPSSRSISLRLTA